MRTTTLGLLSLLVLAVAGVCASGAPAGARQGTLEQEFRAAAAEYGVPVELLKAMGYVNTRWEMPSGESSS